MANFFKKQGTGDDASANSRDEHSLSVDSIDSSDEGSTDGYENSPIQRITASEYRAPRKSGRRKQKIATGLNPTPETRSQRAAVRRRELFVKKKVSIVTATEQELIQRCLGVDEDGYCLRHDDQSVRSGLVTSFRFEGIRTCRSCAFGGVSGVKHKNHGQTPHPVAGMVKGVKKGLGIKQKKKNKGVYDVHLSVSSFDNDTNFASAELNLQTGHSSSETFQHPSLTSTSSMEEAPEGDERITKLDEQWKDEVYLRVSQVLGWDNNQVPLKCHPLYAKYFRMLKRGIPPEEIRETFGHEGPDLLILSLDPDKAFDGQLEGLSPLLQERLRNYGATTCTLSDNPTEITSKIFNAYCKQKDLFDNFLQAEIDKETGSGDLANKIEMHHLNESLKKKKKLRFRKKLKRIVNKKKTDMDHSDDGHHDDAEEDIIEGIHLSDNSSPKPSPGPLQSFSTFSPHQRRAGRRPERHGNRIRNRRASPGTGRNYKVQIGNLDSPKSSISPSPGRSHRPLSQTQIKALLGTSPKTLVGEEKQEVVERKAGLRNSAGFSKSSLKKKVVVTLKQASISEQPEIAPPTRGQTYHPTSSLVSSKDNSGDNDMVYERNQNEESMKITDSRDSINLEKFNDVAGELIMTKEQLQKIQYILRKTQKQFEICQSENQRKDLRIHKLLKTVAQLQDEVSEMKNTKPSQTESPMHPSIYLEVKSSGDENGAKIMAVNDRTAFETRSLHEEEVHKSRMSSNSLEPPEPPLILMDKDESPALTQPREVSLSVSEKKRKKRELEDRLRASVSKSEMMKLREKAESEEEEQDI